MRETMVMMIILLSALILAVVVQCVVDIDQYERISELEKIIFEEEAK